MRTPNRSPTRSPPDDPVVAMTGLEPTDKAAGGALRRVGPEAWDETLDRLGIFDLYFRRHYVSVSTILEEGEPLLLVMEGPRGGVAFAAILRNIPGSTYRDLVTPYGYGGPLATGEEPPLAEFDAALSRWCVQEGVVTSFIRFHPLYANFQSAPPSCHLHQLAPTIGWRLEAGRDLLSAMHGKHRNVIRKAQAAGIQVEVSEGPSSLEEFLELYELTMRRQSAAEFYFFPEAYWREMVEKLRPNLVRFDARLEGTLLASALCFVTHPWMHYHLGASSEAGRSLAASNLILYEAARWAQVRGYTRFHLGGGVGGRNDSLLAFKTRFDPGAECPSYIGKMVHDGKLYAELSGTDSVEGFFPPYRTKA